MRRCAHQVERRETIERGRASHRSVVSGSATAAHAAALITRVADLIPAPPAGLARDDAAWSAFESVLSQAATGLAEAIGTEGRPALEAAMASPLSAAPVTLLLVERTLGQLAESPR